MSRQNLKILVGTVVVAGLTIYLTLQILSLFPTGEGAPEGAEQANFLAHLLLPLSVVLAIFVAITIVGIGVRIGRSLLGSDYDSE